MAAASYTTDLTLIHAADAASASWTEPTGFIDGAITLPETDYFIQGTGCLSKTMGAQAAAVSGAIFNTGAGQTIPSGSALFIWLYFGAPNALNTQAAGGLRVFVGSGTAAFKQWYVKGSNTYTYGGWFCVPVDPNTTQDATTGTPTATLQYFGAAATLNATSAVSKGNPFGIDVLRYGRGEMRINGGDLANGYATFAGYAAQNDAQANRWGLFQAIDGGYLWQGLMVLGFTSAVDFRDSNVAIQVANTQKVTSAFNRIEVRQATSRVDWTGVSISALGTTSRGNFECIDDADVNFETCTFTDMGTFIFRANSTVNNSTFRRCQLVTTGGGAFSGCTFERSPAAVAVATASLSSLTNCTFTSAGTGHAVDLGTIAATQTQTWNCTDSGYGATGTTNATILVNVSASQTLTINVAAGKSTPTVRNTGTGTVNVVSGQVTLTLTGLITGSDIVITTSDTNTERVNVDSHGSSTYAYSYTYAAGTFVDVKIFKESYVPFAVYDYLLSDKDGSLPINQVFDRNFQ